MLLLFNVMLALTTWLRAVSVAKFVTFPTALVTIFPQKMTSILKMDVQIVF